jgi:hypothetical protein
MTIAAVYFMNGRRRPYSVVGMDVVHAETNGWLSLGLSRSLTWVEATAYRDRRSPPHSGRTIVSDDALEVSERLRRDGCVRLGTELPPSLCDDLRAFASSVQCQIVGDEGPIGWGAFDTEARTPGVQYMLPGDLVVAHPAVQTLLADGFFLDVASHYFRRVPVWADVSMWWNTPRPGQASEYLAQKFHWDNDGLEWVKCFVYLTDVDGDAGPHSYVRGSHRPNSVGRSLIRRGTVRLEDEEVLDAFGADRVIEIIGKAGTMFIADTRGLHKAVPPRRRERLVLQFLINNSLLGINRRPLQLGRVSGELETTMASRSRSFRAFTTS